MAMRDLQKDLEWLESLANSSERKFCQDTIHELAMLNTERALEAEALVRELVDALRESRALIISLSLAHSCFDHAESIGKVMSMSTASIIKAKEVLGAYG